MKLGYITLLRHERCYFNVRSKAEISRLNLLLCRNVVLKSSKLSSYGNNGETLLGSNFVEAPRALVNGMLLL